MMRKRVATGRTKFSSQLYARLTTYDIFYFFLAEGAVVLIDPAFYPAQWII